MKMLGLTAAIAATMHQDAWRARAAMDAMMSQRQRRREAPTARQRRREKYRAFAHRQGVHSSRELAKRRAASKAARHARRVARMRAA